jgi:hypothetical protein
VIVKLHIDHLVLDSLSVTGGQSRVVQAAVQAELARQLQARGMDAGVTRARAVPGVKVLDVDCASAAPTHLGAQIARAIGAEIGGRPERHAGRV